MKPGRKNVFSFITHAKGFESVIKQPSYQICFGVSATINYTTQTQTGHAKVLLVKPCKPFICSTVEDTPIVYNFIDVASPLHVAFDKLLGNNDSVELDKILTFPLPVPSNFATQNNEQLSTLIYSWLIAQFEHIIDKEDHSRNKIEKVFEYIELHIKDKIQLVDIANHIQLSIHRTRHLFKEITGVPLIEYVLWKKVMAIVAISRNKSLLFKDTCKGYGFSNHSHCTRRFKGFFNITPTAILKNFTLIQFDHK